MYVDTKRLFLIVLFKGLLASSVLAFSPGDEVIVSFPSVKLQQSERIVGFEINVTTGHIIQVDRIPQDWSLDVQAEVSSTSAISGSTRHGAGALFTASELPKVTIRIDKPFGETAPKFSAEAIIYVTADFEKTRTIRLKEADLVLKKKNI